MENKKNSLETETSLLVTEKGIQSSRKEGNIEIQLKNKNLPDIQDRNPEALYTKRSDWKRKPNQQALEVEQAILPHVKNTLTLRDFSEGLHAANATLDLTESVEIMREYAVSVAQGNLQPMEEMLALQAIVLDTMFNHMGRKACATKDDKSLQVYMNLALKSQNQCRATLQTLGELKNPKTLAFVGQANIAQQQQINNAVPIPTHGQEKTEKVSNELLEPHK